MLKLIVDAQTSTKEEKVQRIEDAFVLDRSNRKFWIIRYKVLFENGTVKTLEESSKVKKTEKDLKYMQSRYLHGWIAKKEKELSAKQPSCTNFTYYAKMYMKECAELEDIYAIGLRTNRILKDFGSIPIDKITKTQIKQWILDLIDKRTDKPLGKNSRGKYLGVFRGVFRQAVEDDAIDRNIVNDIEFNKKRTKRDLEEVRPFNSEEVKLLLKASKSGLYGKYMYDYLSFTFYQGTSPSETLGLQIDDIDFDSKCISINRDVTKNKSKGTKNDFRKREIPMFDASIPVLEKLVSRAKAKGTVWLFSNAKGSHLYDIGTIRGSKEMLKDGKLRRKDTKWYKLIKDCGIDHRHIKNARHTFAVRMIELMPLSNGKITFQGIADMLGHGSLKMLHEHYAKWIKGQSKTISHSVDIYSNENELGDTLGDTSKNCDFSKFLKSA
jgi:integrase